MTHADGLVTMDEYDIELNKQTTTKIQHSKAIKSITDILIFKIESIFV